MYVIMKIKLCLDINECSSNPCQNNGVCVDGVNQFTCSCAAGYAGTLCATSESGFISCYMFVCSGSIVVTTLDSGPEDSGFESRVGANIL